MNTKTLLAAVALSLLVGVQSADAQRVTAYYAPTVTYYSPAPTVTYYAPSVPTPVTAYYAPATTAYYAPSVPVTTYYAPSVPVTTYYAPAATTAYYAPSVPVTTYYASPSLMYNPRPFWPRRRWAWAW